MVVIFTRVTMIRYFIFKNQVHAAGDLTRELSIRFIAGLLWKAYQEVALLKATYSAGTFSRLFFF